ncbi:uncharacterized protein LOC143234129 isoform X4 [Tachypleus tridentatus]|uniref:uncharacterized protein LOC143234129 isoform X4 n=1 Tax=Tachypleus tridentatus TaxID=6853 RepID=UPI003FD06DBC
MSLEKSRPETSFRRSVKVFVTLQINYLLVVDEDFAGKLWLSLLNMANDTCAQIARAHFVQHILSGTITCISTELNESFSAPTVGKHTQEMQI